MHKSLFRTALPRAFRQYSACIYILLFLLIFIPINLWAEKEKAFSIAELRPIRGDFPQSCPQILWTRILRFDCRYLASISILRAKM